MTLRSYTRRYVYESSEKTIEEYKRSKNVFSVAIIDLDDFKNVNDNFGHLGGDYILKEFTRILQENLRPYDILGRYGGEEFIIILNHSTIMESKLLLERLLKIIRDKVFIYNKNHIRITFSAGISCCSEVSKDKLIIDNLVKIADKRMYHGKKQGKNRIIYK